MTTRRYLEILASGQPFAYGTDNNGRTFFSCNFRVRTVGAAPNVADDMAGLIEAANLGESGATLFIGQAAVLPAGDGPFVLVVDTGGGEPLETQNGRRDERPAFQVVVRAKSYTDGAARARAIFELLDGKRDLDVTP